MGIVEEFEAEKRKTTRIVLAVLMGTTLLTGLLIFLTIATIRHAEKEAKAQGTTLTREAAKSVGGFFHEVEKGLEESKGDSK